MKNQSFVAPLAFWTHAVNAAEIEIAVRAYDRGDFSSALVSFHTLADQGNSRAQHYLGDMYSKGHGVPRQVRAGLDWHRKRLRGDIAKRRRCSVFSIQKVRARSLRTVSKRMPG